MLTNIVKKVFGTSNDREVKRMRKTVAVINGFEEELNALSDEQLQAKTPELKARLEAGESLDEILPEAFAVAREAGLRSLGMRHFDVQMLGGMTLHSGRISEMRTGEGKTLVATLPVYLNALTGRGVYVVTVNDYLASRDANWMRPLYEFLGLSVGSVVSGMDPASKKAAYEADITYGTNNEFGFDYLRDNMAFTLEERVQRDKYFAIVDEVDSILIDEARTPLIISGAAEDSSALYTAINRVIPSLKEAEVIEKNGEQHVGEGHYTLDEKTRTSDLTEEGHDFIEGFLLQEKLLNEGDNLYSAANLKLLHHVQTALKAHVLFSRDVDYIVQNNQIVLVDEHTGRTMEGRRLSEGLHQAIEAKEGVAIQSESQTLASTTFQNYFRLFEKLAGMTGTADTEAAEFHQIYGLDVVVIPTNKPIERQDLNDVVYMTVEEKFEAIAKDIVEYRDKGAPVLVGTASIETSERMSAMLKQEGIEHKVLNAKFHEQEAEIVAQAGRPGAVTIATNMAGRGTDIVLGGNLEAEMASMDSDAARHEATEAWKLRHEQVLNAGGLHILGTERHESRRIDNQLRGRAGRQGDPGVTRFYLSLEDDLMRIFASDRVRNIMQALGMERGEAIEHRMVSNAIEKAQRKVEGRNFDIRKSLLEFDDVANDQRQVVYRQREDILTADSLTDVIETIRKDVAAGVFAAHIPPQSLEEMWDVPGLEQTLESEFGLSLPVAKWLEEDDKMNESALQERIEEAFAFSYNHKMDAVGDQRHRFEKHVMLQVLDGLWKEHLATMDHLRQGIHLRGYAGKNPKQEYKRESFELFEQMLESVKYDVTRFLARVQIQTEEEIAAAEEQSRLEHEREQAAARTTHADASALAAAPEQSAEGEAPTAEPAQPFVREGRKVGRNEPCPCGSGKKYKQCHGALE
ncbi:Protein translocase subunit SecA [BD1-7 clade bacterium]|uniref:Protein translocase subunit SecA n=1 Tax=BD1-7 clade bacterium TaxID=2029982 RepID=A0A5S9N381_9GAMM|nr:Protein translocase subunit SecA [BD1-7 clade bacterium]